LILQSPGEKAQLCPLLVMGILAVPAVGRWKKEDVGNMRNFIVFAIVAAFAVGTAAVARATTAECGNGALKRNWDSGAGAYVYEFTDPGGGGYGVSDGCPDVTCDGGSGDQCYAYSIIGTNNYYCKCTQSGWPTCTAVYHVGTSGVDAATCTNKSCPGDCLPVWSPLHSLPQTLSCPCT
jgi:hypothetical protein